MSYLSTDHITSPFYPVVPSILCTGFVLCFACLEVTLDFTYLSIADYCFGLLLRLAL